MAQVLAKVFKVLLIIGLIWFGLWTLTQFGIFSMKDVVLNLVSCLPGFSDIVPSYELGQRQSALLKKQQEALAQKQRELDAAQAKLFRDQDAFTRMQNDWINAHPSTTPPSSGVSNHGKIVLNPTKTPDKKIKEYLSLVGNMRPKQAAAVIQKLPEETIFILFDQLRRDQVVKIMENLPESFLSKLTMDRLNQYRNI